MKSTIEYFICNNRR